MHMKQSQLARKGMILAAFTISLDHNSCSAQTVPDPATPPGSGRSPSYVSAPPLLAGDAMPPHAVPTGIADYTSGSKFPTIEGGSNRALILTPGFRRGESLMQYRESAPYPKVSHIMVNGKSYQYIDQDSPAGGATPRSNNWYYGGIPTVGKVGRYFVILAVVVGTILLAFAAFGVILGQQNAGAKVTFSAGGLMLLFMAFTIWKVAQANMVNWNEGGKVDENKSRLPHQIILPDVVPSSQSPVAPGTPPRSGIPVAPLGSQ